MLSVDSLNNAIGLSDERNEDNPMLYKDPSADIELLNVWSMLYDTVEEHRI